jgi:hypothetical protein
LRIPQVGGKVWYGALEIQKQMNNWSQAGENKQVEQGSYLMLIILLTYWKCIWFLENVGVHRTANESLPQETWLEA